MVDPTIIVHPFESKEERERRIATHVAIENNHVPLRILCPRCKDIYTLYVESLEQGLHTLLGQACPNCKRFIRESDDPEDLLIDLAEIKQIMGGTQ